MSYLFILIIVLLVAYGMLKQYNPQAVLLSAGLFLLAYAQIAGIARVLPIEKTNGNILFDLWDLFTNITNNRLAKVGLILVSIAGVSSYMNAIGASKALVHATSRIISKIKNPYILLYVSMILVFIIYIFVTGATSLSLLLMGTLYPILRSAGLSAKTVVATIVIPTAWEYGPGQMDVVLAAQNSNMEVMAFVVKHQTLLTLILVIFIPFIHVLWQTHLDKKDKHDAETAKQAFLKELSTNKDGREIDAPSYYRFLPFLPFLFLVAFSDLFTSKYKMTIPIAMMLTMMISIIIEAIRFLSIKKAFANFSAWLKGTGDIFAAVVTLLLAAEFFAEGLKHIGAIDSLIHLAETVSLSPTAIAIFFSVFIMIISFITGSGNAPFMAFVTLVPAISTKFNIDPVILVIPLIFAAGVGRTLSPVAGVIITVAGMSGVSTFDVVKRTSIPTIISMFIVWFWVIVRY